jgi:hypothetical protein
MSALAAYLRERAADDLRQLDPVQRIQLALALGDDDLRLYCAANRMPIEAGRRRLMATRQAGRRVSGAAVIEA